MISVAILIVLMINDANLSYSAEFVSQVGTKLGVYFVILKANISINSGFRSIIIYFVVI